MAKKPCTECAQLRMMLRLVQQEKAAKEKELKELKDER